MKRIALSIALSLGLLGCSDPIDMGAESSLLSQSETFAQSIAWQSYRGSSGYTIEVYRSCNCIKPADYFYNYRMSVNSSNNKILIEAIDINGNTTQILPDNSYYLSLEEIFAYINVEIGRGRTVYGNFHEEEAYPTSLEIGFQETYSIQVTEYF